MTFFECFPDESFLKSIGFTSGQLSGGHSLGRSKVCGKLRNSTNSLALIDEDPFSAQDPYLKYLLSLRPSYKDPYLICVKDAQRNNKLIVLRPDLEQLCMKLARESNVKLSSSKYSLPESWEDLHEVLTLKKNVEKRKKFIEFIRDVSTHNAIMRIKEFINN